jgi:hypothetical protein
LTVAVLGFYALIRAPVLNPQSYLDCWIYTALFTHFDYVYGAFTSSYYTSRLPWIIPGIAANALLPPVGAFFLLHITFFVGGALFAFGLLRRFYGNRVAVIGYAALLLSVLFYDSHSNDYPDGAMLTYLLGAAYFALGAQHSRLRWLRMVAAGFFAAAALGTNLFSAVAVAGLVLVYVVVFSAGAGFLQRVARDTAFVLAGMAALVAACGAVAKTHGGEFLFLMPSWRFARTIETASWKRPGYEWMLGETQLLIPVFLLVVLLFLLARTRLRGWQSDPPLRFAAGSALFLLYMDVVIGVWEFFHSGDFLEVYYYFSIFIVPVAFALGSVIYLLARSNPAWLDARTLAAGVVAAVLPIGLVYAPFDVAPVARAAFPVVCALMAVAFGLCFVAQRRGPRVTVLMAVALTVFSVNYASAAGALTQSIFRPSSELFFARRASLSMAMQLIHFMESNGLERAVPAFWYNGPANPPLNGIQSTYLWGTTAIGFDMPHFDKGERTLLEARRPPYIVLLCTSEACDGGPAALERAGYRLRPKARTVIAAGGTRYWVEAYRVPRFRLVFDPFYDPARSPFARRPAGTPLWRVSFARGLPDGWSGSATVVPGTPARATTEARPWAYSVVSPRQTLAPGSYRLYLSGKVLAGGLDLGALDVGANRWIEQSFYWSRQHGFARGWMSTRFRVDAPTQVEVVLSNWVPGEQASRWELRELRLARVP